MNTYTQRKALVKWVFDMDDTLIHTDKAVLEEQYYLGLEPSSILPTYKFFRELLNQGEAIYILTNRHPIMQKTIAQYFGLDASKVYCRNFCLTMNEILAVQADKQIEATFLNQMMRFKAAILDNLAYESTFVVYLDDMYEQWENHRDVLSKNIVILAPIVSHDRTFVPHLTLLEKDKTCWNQSEALFREEK